MIVLGRALIWGMILMCPVINFIAHKGWAFQFRSYIPENDDTSNNVLHLQCVIFLNIQKNKEHTKHNEMYLGTSQQQQQQQWRHGWLSLSQGGLIQLKYTKSVVILCRCPHCHDIAFSCSSRMFDVAY